MADSKTQKHFKQPPYWKIGEPMIWITGAVLGIIVLVTVVLIAVVMANGLGVFWPSNVAVSSLRDGTSVLGEIVQEKTNSKTGQTNVQFKVGNRDLYNIDFRWVAGSEIVETTFPPEVVVLERMEYGNFYGYLQQVSGLQTSTESESLWNQFNMAEQVVHERMKGMEDLNVEIGELTEKMSVVRREELKLQYREISADSPEYQKLMEESAQLEYAFEELLKKQNEALKEIQIYKATFTDVSGQSREIDIMEIARAFRPNQMSTLEKVGFYLHKFGELLTDEPREANTEGGLFPAIFGTVMMVFIMSLLSFPLGVITAIYLREYAKEGVIVRLVRIAVNNLAGIPSIVYGVFGLGFFVYGMGGIIDRIFFPEVLPTPTFGTGGILWASLTLGILTVPVVIVATEEALSSVPLEMREASLALGATQLQTLLRVVLPMSSPGIMTGFILAMARAAGEVAPLMITGVVKLAPSLPLDGVFPFVHLERKFMHLGFHIYDVGFQSPNVEAAKPMVFVTTFLLVMIVLVMSSVAIYLRNMMRKRYTIQAF